MKLKIVNLFETYKRNKELWYVVGLSNINGLYVLIDLTATIPVYFFYESKKRALDAFDKEIEHLAYM